MRVSYPRASRFLRKLRGGCQAHLIQADDGHFYAAKSPENPQTKRVLVNEFLGAKVFEHLGIASAAITPLQIPRSFLNSYPDVHLILHKQRIPFRAGVFLGSRFEVDPQKTAIYDLLPRGMVCQIINTSDFLGALIADQWLSNQDRRQFVYFRQRTLGRGSARGFRALSIDHGMCLGGPSWRLGDSPLTGVYFDTSVYRPLNSKAQIERWLEKLNTIGEDDFRYWIEQLPAEWVDEDTSELQDLVGQLLRRRRRVPELIEAAIEAHPESFGNLAGRPTGRAESLPLEKEPILA